MPRCFSPLAASRPSKPPPMTTAWRKDLDALIMVSTSFMSRKVMTPGRLLPGTGIMNGLEPVASSSRSYSAAVPSRATTFRARRLISVTSQFLCSVMPLAAYHGSSFSRMSGKAFSPASTGESRMRL